MTPPWTTRWPTASTAARSGESVNALANTVSDAKVIDPHAGLETKETLERLQHAVEQLPEPERDYVRLFYLKGMTQTAIAKQYNCSPSTVCIALERARVMLQASLAPNEPSPNS